MSYGKPGAYGTPQGQGYGAPQSGYGAPQSGYGNPQGGYQAPPGGYGAPPPSGYPPVHDTNRPPPPPKPATPAGDPRLWEWFKAADVDNNGSITAPELQRILVNGDWTPFNPDTVKLMINMFDTNQSGTIQYNEFVGLWKYIEDWQRCFRMFDADGSGSIDAVELRNALRTFGYNLSDRFIHILIRKHDIQGSTPSTGRGSVTFDAFVSACVTVKTLTDSFRRFDTQGTGWIQINYEQFLELVVQSR